MAHCCRNVTTTATRLIQAMKTKSSLPRFCAIALAVAASTSSQFAADVVNDTWLDGTRTDPASPVYSEYGYDSDGDLNTESAWLKGGAGTLTVVGAGGPLRGSGFGASSASWYTYFTPAATPVTLGSIGDYMKLTWSFTLSGVNAGNTSQGFNIAVAQTPGSGVRTTGDASVPSAAYKGYAMFMNMAPTLGNANPFRLMEWNTSVASGALLGTSGNWTALANGATTGNAGYADGISYTYTMLLTRTGSGLDIVSTMTGGTLNGSGTATVSFSDATPSTFAYDTFDIRPTSEVLTASQFDTTLFKVETNAIPEPSTMLFSGLGALAFAVWRRVRR